MGRQNAGIRQFAHGLPDLAKHSHHLRLSLLICLFATWPLAATCHAAEPAAARMEVSRTSPLDADDPMQRWFKEQDKLLDEILTRLGRIETVVSQIHRLIAQMPDQMQPPPAPATSPPAAVQPVPPAIPTQAASPPAVTTAKPVAPATPPPAAEFDIMEWVPALAGGLGVLLVLFWWSRRRSARSASSQTKAATPAVTPPPANPATPDPRPKAAPLEPPARKLAAPPSAAKTQPAPSSVQTGGASQLANGQLDQALELAEIMLSMGLGHGAAQTLAEQIRNEPKQALRHWLKLLEIYRQNGQQNEFERLSEELRLHFNVQAEDWNAPSESQRSIEDYPHIAARMVELWGKPSCLSYLQNLLDDNRGGARSGFPQSVAEEFLLLSTLLKDRLKAGD